ncbi:MAG: GDP-mannose 4,6-dehydratase [Candidatus Micrarchaeia archaeon]|jgi:GDPmannose 4,6-dehydratase
MAKKALIYGILGQDGFYLSKLLSEKGYAVAGVARKECSPPHSGKTYVADLAGKPDEFLFPINDFLPDEIYNLAGISSVHEAEADPLLCGKVNAEAVQHLLSRMAASCPRARFFQASSGYIYSGSGTVDEKSAPNPSSAYGKSKLAAQRHVEQARAQGAFACYAILFNHESPMRSPKFVTRKITMGASRIKLGLSKKLALGSLDARRDWGFAGDYVEAMWLMLQQKQPEDYVIATGESHSVRELCEAAFSHVGLDYKKFVETDQSLVRQNEPELRADARCAQKKLGWRPKTGFSELVSMMVDADLNLLRQGESI